MRAATTTTTSTEETSTTTTISTDDKIIPNTTIATDVLRAHRPNCPNESRSFAEIRQICPTVPLTSLWDLFQKCNGSADETLDIIMEEVTHEYSNNAISQDDLSCNCDANGTEEPVALAESMTSNVAAAAAASPLRTTPSRSRRDRHHQQHEAVKRQIEENFVLSDDLYSEHTRKIRNIRRGLPPPDQQLDEAQLVVPELATAVSASAAAVQVQSDDEMLEINLGTELINQLDSVFGFDAFRKESKETELKTNVFMPKSLAQQLYAIWMESLYNQIEEQRQRAIVEDEEFARQLHDQQEMADREPAAPAATTTTAAPLSGTAADKKNIQDVVDMELAWAAYKKEQADDDWRKGKHDLATQMSLEKLFALFPHIERDTLVDVLATNGNRFSETVSMLNSTGLQPVALDTADTSAELMEQAKIEADIVSCSFHFIVENAVKFVWLKVNLNLSIYL